MSNMSKEDKKKKDEQIEEQGGDNCEKCEEYIHGWKKALADYENLQKQLSEERDTIRSRAKEGLVHELLPVLDNFDHAIAFAPDPIPTELQGWATGMLHVRNQLEDVLKGFGVEPFGQAGEAFNTDLHEAAGEEKEEDKEDQSIIKIVLRGWKMGEKIIRPAKVIVNNLK